VLECEVLPGFRASGLLEEATAYVSETIDRFRNPHLNHFLSDIFVGHNQKVKSRINGFLAWAKASGDHDLKPCLANLVEIELENLTW
jgi:tagaturonate reductase